MTDGDLPGAAEEMILLGRTWRIDHDKSVRNNGRAVYVDNQECTLSWLKRSEGVLVRFEVGSPSYSVRVEGRGDTIEAACNALELAYDAMAAKLRGWA